ncbi:uncharacterized protein LOC116350811 [Contarinia nasturtii]|uniref:uncharacterized protein LOC116350811 n=1 Tax=Contarinia nasturtii TaxID=265458 RepID=UPI0012D43A75|nr:uncharacterized protein LOC116350811 [Contarinia nasturtii]
MRSIVAILSLFLIAQVVNSEFVKFDLVAKKFYKLSKVIKSPQLDFLLKITKDTNAIKKKLDKLPRKNVIDPKVAENIIYYVPEDLKFNGISAREILRGKVKSINDMEINTVPQLDAQICNKMAYEILDGDINKFYETWASSGYTDNSHLKKVEQNIGRMKTKFENWQKNFDKNMKEADIIRTTIKSMFSEKTAIVEAANGNAEKKIDALFEKILLKESELVGKLTNANEILRLYNEERLVWTEFIMGKRRTLTDNLLLTNH